MQAAIGVAQADRISEFVEKRRRNFMRLYKGLEFYQDYFILPTLDPRSNPSWFGFPITVKNSFSRQEIVQWLENANIETRMIFAGNILHQPAFRSINRRIVGSLEQSETIMNNTFFIGVYPGLTEEMIDFMVKIISDFVKKKNG